ncbi:hypothetical protein BH20CHL6_BH20CHL6_07640 [soil metagenome]
MYVWRRAIVIGFVFLSAGLIYFFVQGRGEFADLAGVTMLMALGVAMAFAALVLLRGSEGR